MMKDDIALVDGQIKSRGDTIVEVLISVTIISFVLGAAYLLTSRSLQAGLAARERTEAMNLVQGQIERLKSVKERLSSADFTNTYRVAAPYCLVSTPTNVVSQQRLSNDTNKRCQVDSDHLNGNGRYRLNTTYINSGTNRDTFKFSAGWERVGSGTAENVDIYYRTTP